MILWLGVSTAWETVWKGRSIRKAESHCLRVCLWRSQIWIQSMWTSVFVYHRSEVRWQSRAFIRYPLPSIRTEGTVLTTVPSPLDCSCLPSWSKLLCQLPDLPLWVVPESCVWRPCILPHLSLSMMLSYPSTGQSLLGKRRWKPFSLLFDLAAFLPETLGPHGMDPVLVGKVPSRVWLCLGSGSKVPNPNWQQERLVGQLRVGISKQAWQSTDRGSRDWRSFRK